ncbi:hypothetical protein BDR03DRAFT_939751 [Suillus americanus]|nr:hypothetical protein BDR03DRAFT_939751 [Suillus americanus]
MLMGPEARKVHASFSFQVMLSRMEDPTTDRVVSINEASVRLEELKVDRAISFWCV